MTTLKELAFKMYNKKYKLDLSKKENVLKEPVSRETCRQLIEQNVLIPAYSKGVTRHKQKSIKKVSRKTIWITQIRKLRTLLKLKRVQYNLSSSIYRKLYLLMKANKISTKRKLEQKIHEFKKKEL